MLTHLLVSIVILALASSASSQVATTMSGLPLSRHGYTYFAGDASSPISVEMVIDLTCSETRDAWEVLSAVVSGYSDSVKFNIQILPLPYHQFSFLVSKAASTVLFFEGDKQAFKFMNEAILNQPAIYNSEPMTNPTMMSWRLYKVGLRTLQLLPLQNSLKVSTHLQMLEIP